MPLGASDQQTYEFGYGDGLQGTYTAPYRWVRAYLYENEIEERFVDLITESYENGYAAGTKDREIEKQWREAA